MALCLLGIESSCDETAVAVVRRDDAGKVEVLSSVIHSQITHHAAFGGVVPEIAARSHVETIDGLFQEALAQAKSKGVSIDMINAIAATAGPGLIGGVMVGLSFAKGLALSRGLPLLAVNHLEGHALSVRLTEEVPFPFLLLLVSGGHCQILIVRGVGDYERLGSTIDDAAGEAFDKIAKTLGLGYPGGPALEACAKRGNPNRFSLPRALLGRKGYDFSFSGLKTAASRLAVLEVKTPQDRADLCASVQAAIAQQLSERTSRSMLNFKEKFDIDRPVFVVAGGVAANQTVRQSLMTLCENHGFLFAAPPLIYCTDNAAMIALAGLEQLSHLKKNRDFDESALARESLNAVARPRWPLDAERAQSLPIHKDTGRKGAKA
jgi:N6-L-threonylcarbamoyladenine synthase